MKKKRHNPEESKVLKTHHFVKKDLEELEDALPPLEEDIPREPPANRHGKKMKDTVSAQLVEIYKNKDGSLPNMSDFQKRKSSRTLRAFFTLIFSCLFLVAVVFAGIFFFKPTENFSKDNVTVAVTGESNITSGALTHYRIRYRNDETVPVTKAKIVVRFPDGFVFQESSVPSVGDSHNEWDLGTLNSGESGFLDIYGFVYGDIGSEASFRVFLNYTPANFSSEFQAVGLAKITIGESPVALSVTGPATTVPGALTSIIFTIIPRQSSTTLQNVTLVIDPGAGFVQKTSNPPSDNFGAWTWSVPNLKAEKSITVSGAFTATPGVKEYTLKAKLVGSLSASNTQKSFILDEKEYRVVFDESQLSSEFTINGASDALSVSPGEVLHVNATIKNNLASPVTNIRASVSFDAPSFQNKSILNWLEVKDEKNGLVNGQQIGTDIRRGIISWDKTKISSLANIPATTQVPITFTIPIKTAAEAPLANFKEHTIHATLEVQYEVDGKKQVFVGTPIEITINSDFAVQSTLEKKTHDSGKDQFFVTWHIQNSSHNMQTVVLNAQVYGDITWSTDELSVPVGNLKFDEKEKKIVWTSDTLPPTDKPTEIVFSFLRNNFNPTQTQLISKIQLTGKDSVTGKDVIVFGSPTLNSF